MLALFGGLLVGWVVRWLLGAASVLPATTELMAWLTSQGVPVADLSVAGSQGRARLEGAETDGSMIRRLFRPRHPAGSGAGPAVVGAGPSPVGGRGARRAHLRARVEQLSLACFLAERARVPSPEVVLLGEMPGETLVLVTSIPDGRPGVEAASPRDGVVVRVAAAPARLRRRAPRPAAGQRLHRRDLAGFRSLDAAEPAASELTRRLDLVQRPDDAGQSRGAADAVTALRAAHGPSTRPPSGRSCSRLALAPWGWRAMRAARVRLTRSAPSCPATGRGADAPAGTIPLAYRADRESPSPSPATCSSASSPA